MTNDVLSGERLEEIIAANPPKSDFPRRGPDTPCKVLKSEADEAKEGTRAEALEEEGRAVEAVGHGEEDTRVRPRGAETASVV